MNVNASDVVLTHVPDDPTPMLATHHFVSSVYHPIIVLAHVYISTLSTLHLHSLVAYGIGVLSNIICQISNTSEHP